MTALVRDAADLRDLLRAGAGRRTPSCDPQHFDPVSDRDVLLRLENNVRLRLAKREDWAGAAQSLDRMLAIAPDRPELLFEAGQLNARLDKRRAAIAAFERFLDIEGEAGRSRPCASGRRPCCRNCAAGLTDVVPSSARIAAPSCEGRPWPSRGTPP